MGRPATTRPLTIRPEDDYVPDGLPAAKTVTPTAARDFKSQREALTRPQVAGYKDPVCIALVMDLLLRLDPSSQVRAGSLAAHMDMLYPQFIWAPVTVGKILADIAEATTDAGCPDTDVPFRATKRNGGLVYRMSGSLLSWRWMVRARERLGVMGLEAIAAQRAGTATAEGYRAFPWEAFDHSWGT